MKNIFNFSIYIFLSFLILFSNNHYTNKNKYYKLYIPKIKLHKNIYEFYDINNNVDKNIYLALDYNFDTLKGSLVLAAHSGNSSISYFDDLHKLRLNDEVIIEGRDYIYTYLIDDSFIINKNGYFKYIDKNKRIYLITCVKENHKEQLVYGGFLKKITKKSTFS